VESISKEIIVYSNAKGHIADADLFICQVFNTWALPYSSSITLGAKPLLIIIVSRL